MFNDTFFLLMALKSCCGKKPTAYHVVHGGQTLWDLAKMYNISFEQLKAANPQINNPDLIFPGQIIALR